MKEWRSEAVLGGWVVGDLVMPTAQVLDEGVPRRRVPKCGHGGLMRPTGRRRRFSCLVGPSGGLFAAVCWVFV